MAAVQFSTARRSPGTTFLARFEILPPVGLIGRLAVSTVSSSYYYDFTFFCLLRLVSHTAAYGSSQTARDQGRLAVRRPEWDAARDAPRQAALRFGGGSSYIHTHDESVADKAYSRRLLPTPPHRIATSPCPLVRFEC